MSRNCSSPLTARSSVNLHFLPVDETSWFVHLDRAKASKTVSQESSKENNRMYEDNGHAMQGNPYCNLSGDYLSGHTYAKKYLGVPLATEEGPGANVDNSRLQNFERFRENPSLG